MFLQITHRDQIHLLVDQFAQRVKVNEMKYKDFAIPQEEKPPTLLNVSLEEWLETVSRTFTKRLRFSIGEEAKKKVFSLLNKHGNNEYKNGLPSSDEIVAIFVGEAKLTVHRNYNFQSLLDQFMTFFIHRLINLKLQLGRNSIEQHKRVGTVRSTKLMIVEKRLKREMKKFIKHINLIIHCYHHCYNILMEPLTQTEVCSHHTNVSIFHSLLCYNNNTSLLNYEIERTYFTFICERDRIIEEYCILLHEMQNSLEYMSRQIEFLDVTIGRDSRASELDNIWNDTDPIINASILEYCIFQRKCRKKKCTLLSIKSELKLLLTTLKTRISRDTLLLSHIGNSSLFTLVQYMFDR